MWTQLIYLLYQYAPKYAKQLNVPVLQKIGIVGIFYCFNYKNLIHIVISYLNFKSKHRDKCKFAVKLISLANTSNFFSH